jgi:FkbM family methyltransferase
VRSEYVAILEHFGISQVLDVGAHEGHSARGLFENGFTGSVISFEPVTAHFTILEEAADRGRAMGWNWATRNFALGDACGTAEINIAGNGQSSSLVGMLEEHVRLNPGSSYIGEETVQIRTLDSLADELLGTKQRTLLQLDVQGFERQVLCGASLSLPDLAAVQLEVSLRPVYQGDLSTVDAFSMMEREGMVPVYMQPAWKDPVSCIFYQMDALWVRKTLL